jgi:hypothetical protein
MNRLWIRCVLLGVGCLLGGGLGCDSGNSASKAAPASTSRSPATAPLDYLAAQGQAKKHSEKVISVAQVQQAIQQFQAMEERFPKDLQELVSRRYLAAVPQPGRGQRFTYDPATGAVRVVAAP